jgi:hypothetical protein
MFVQPCLKWQRSLVIHYVLLARNWTYEKACINLFPGSLFPWFQYVLTQMICLLYIAGNKLLWHHGAISPETASWKERSTAPAPFAWYEHPLTPSWDSGQADEEWSRARICAMEDWLCTLWCCSLEFCCSNGLCSCAKHGDHSSTIPRAKDRDTMVQWIVQGTHSSLCSSFY